MDSARGLLVAVALILLALTVAFVLPFLDFFLLAVLLTVIFLPVQERLEDRLGSSLAATVIVVVVTVTVLVPLVYVAQATAADALALYRAVSEGEVSFAGAEERIQELTGVSVDIAGQLEAAAAGVEPGSVVSVFGALTHVLIGLGLTVFLLFYFLKDREHFFSWLRRRAPLSEGAQSQLAEDLDRILKAVLVGHVLVAVVQGLLAGIGLVATGVPNATLWTVVMTVLSLLPVVGSFLVWGPAAVYLFVTGDTVGAVALAVWGTVVVGISDDYLRPVVVDRYAQVNPAVIIVGVLGGVYVVGFMGIFFGPCSSGCCARRSTYSPRSSRARRRPDARSPRLFSGPVARPCSCRRRDARRAINVRLPASATCETPPYPPAPAGGPPLCSTETTRERTGRTSDSSPATTAARFSWRAWSTTTRPAPTACGRSSRRPTPTCSRWNCRRWRCRCSSGTRATTASPRRARR